MHQLWRTSGFHQRSTPSLWSAQPRWGGIAEGPVLPQMLPNPIRSWHIDDTGLRLAGLTLKRARFIPGPQKAGIGCSVHWISLHMRPHYR